jgi:hypothetical protein
MKTICAIMSAFLLIASSVADAKGNTGGALSALVLSVLWFIGWALAPSH